MAVYKAFDWVNVHGRHWWFYLHMTLSIDIPTIPTTASSISLCQRNDLVYFKAKANVHHVATHCINIT
jgi:hypothetical protein